MMCVCYRCSPQVATVAQLAVQCCLRSPFSSFIFRTRWTRKSTKSHHKYWHNRRGDRTIWNNNNKQFIDSIDILTSAEKSLFCINNIFLYSFISFLYHHQSVSMQRAAYSKHTYAAHMIMLVPTKKNRLIFSTRDEFNNNNAVDLSNEKKN